MASFVTFTPNTIHRLEIKDFHLGKSQGKNADLRALPGHLKVLAKEHVREGIIQLGLTVPIELIQQAWKNKTLFNTIVINQPHRSVILYGATITRFTQYLDEPKKIFLSYQKYDLIEKNAG